MEKCRLCGTSDDISFEHVPPKSCFNSTTRYTKVPFLEYIQRKDLLKSVSKLKIEQGGVGFHSLCRSCNTKLGLNYVRAYHEFVRCLGYIISRNESNYFQVEIRDLQPLAILKQVISMFLTVNDYKFSQTFKELTDFVNEPNSNSLPDRYRIFCYLNSEGAMRHFPLCAKGNFNSKNSIICSEITFPPAGFVLTIDCAEEIGGLTEITHFKEAAIKLKNDVEISIYKLPTISPIILDYRSQEQIDYELIECSVSRGYIQQAGCCYAG
jgi:hypothetical protein